MARTKRQEKLKGVIRSGKAKDTQYNGKNIKTRTASRGNEKPYTEGHTIKREEHTDKKSLKV